MRARRDIYVDILSDGLLAIRYAAHRGDAERCFAEADHLHNVPSLLDEPDERKHRYYWEAERPSYLAKMGTKYDGTYDRLWAELAGTTGRG